MTLLGFGKKEAPAEAPLSRAAEIERQITESTAAADAKAEKIARVVREISQAKGGAERAGKKDELVDLRAELEIEIADIAKMKADLVHERGLDTRAAKIAKFHSENPEVGEETEAALKIIRQGFRALSEACARGRAVVGLALELGGPRLGYSPHPSIVTAVDEKIFERLCVGAEISRFDLVRWPTLRVANEGHTSLKNGGLEDEAELARGRTLDAELALRAGGSTK